MSAFGSASYSVSRPTGRCAASGHPIEPGQRFVAALLHGAADDGLLERADFLVDQWPPPPEIATRIIGFWRAVMPQPGAKPTRLIDDSALLDLFDQTNEMADSAATQPSAADAARTEAYRYILALILLRRKLLVVDHLPASGRGGASEASSDLFVRRKGDKPAPGEVVIQPATQRVRVPRLSETELIQLTDQLTSLLLGGGETPPPSSASPPSTPAPGSSA